MSNNNHLAGILILAFLVPGTSRALPTEGGARAEPQPETLSEGEKIFILGNTQFILLHELGHAFIHDLDVPLLGREEDAADTFATILMLRQDRRNPDSEENFLKMLFSAAEAWALSWQKEQQEDAELAFWNRHAISAQRFYNMACFIYGSDPEKFAAIPDLVNLPPGRADWCEEEFQVASRSLNRLFGAWMNRIHTSDDDPRSSIAVDYGVPETPLSRQLRDLFREERILEKNAEFFQTALFLPRNFTIKFNTCGFPGAGWDNEEREVVLCYEFMEVYRELARNRLLEKEKEFKEEVLEP